MWPKTLRRGIGCYGLSHLAEGDGRQENGVTIVESIHHVREVDIVTNPATATSLMEQDQSHAPKYLTPAPAKPVTRPPVRDVPPTNPRDLARWLRRPDGIFS